MNRITLCIVLAIAVVVGVIFGVHARFDIDLSRPFFDWNEMRFTIGAQPWERRSRLAARVLITLIAAPSFIAIVGKLVLPHRPMLIGGRVALFLVLTLAIGPGLVANTLLKDHWSRARPIDIVTFGGHDHFTPWWDPRGSCPNNCSFIAGEPSGAFWTLAAAAVTPPQWRLLAYGGAIAFGVAVGALRLVAGEHFFTDAVFAGIFMYLIAWIAHGFIFRWRATCLREDSVERALARTAEAIRHPLAALARRTDGQHDKRL